MGIQYFCNGRYYNACRILHNSTLPSSSTQINSSKWLMLTPQQVEELYGISKVVVYKNGLVIERKQRYPMKQTTPPLKNGIYELTRKSKMRLTHIVQNCEVGFLSMFTLTYGDYINPIDGRELKRQVNILLGHLRKRFKNIQYLWFLEFTKKGKPHLHVIVSLEPTQFDRIWLGEVWAKISVYDAVKRLLDDKGNGLRVVHPINMFDVLGEAQKVYRVHSHKRCWEKIRKSDGAARYCLKYATKQEQKLVPPQFGNVGRFWGVSSLVQAKPIGEVIIGETMSEDQIKAIFSDTRIGELELIPKYVFQRDALEFYSSRGLRLTEIFDEKNEDVKKQKPENMID